jgi:hypothetical protein
MKERVNLRISTYSQHREGEKKIHVFVPSMRFTLASVVLTMGFVKAQIKSLARDQQMSFSWSSFA